MENIKNQTKYIVGIIIIILIAAGVYYYYTLPIPGIGENTQGESLDNEEETPTTQETDKEVVPENNNNDEISIVETKDKEAFNLALSNGTKEFQNKNYTKALSYYNEALTYSDSDVVYIRISDLYATQGNWTKAIEMINKAIEKNSLYTDYWVTKLVMLDEKSDSSFSDLKKIYTEGLTKVGLETKVNLITAFAKISENNGEVAEAIKAWEEAIKIYPDNKDIYQTEINRLKS